jgi:hypothetical protein
MPSNLRNMLVFCPRGRNEVKTRDPEMSMMITIFLDRGSSLRSSAKTVMD